MIEASSHRSLRRSPGFTIVELLIVIIVIGILAALVLVAYATIQVQAKDKTRAAAAATIRDAAVHFDTFSSTSAYPAQGSGFATDLATITTTTVDVSITSRIGTNAPTAATADAVDNTNGAYQYTYCGTTKTATGATGVRVAYWSSLSSSVQYVYGGNGNSSNC